MTTYLLGVCPALDTHSFDITLTLSLALTIGSENTLLIPALSLLYDMPYGNLNLMCDCKVWIWAVSLATKTIGPVTLAQAGSHPPTQG
jgi:hypothetical protein